MPEDDETKDNTHPKMEKEIRLDVAVAPEIESIEIFELLGKGGMSLVYRARQKELDRIVAVKVLSKLAVRGEDALKRFQKEAKITSTLEHPNIVKTISFGVSRDEQPYLVMEYLEGMSLADDLKQNGRLRLQKFKDVFLPALSALNQAHQFGLIHRDIKPGNIMICRNENGAETVKLVDFGISKAFGESEGETEMLTRSGAVLGSPTYMSPEQCQGKPLDGRSDLYSMACVMYETLSGEPPFTGESLLEVMQKHSAEPPPTVSDLSRKIDIRKELATVTLWGLAKDPAARPQTASEFAKKLNEVLERITLDKVPRLKIAAGQGAKRAYLAAFLLALLVVIALLGRAVMYTTRTRHAAQVGDSLKKDCLSCFATGIRNFRDRKFVLAQENLIKTIRLAYGPDHKLSLQPHQLSTAMACLRFIWEKNGIDIGENSLDPMDREKWISLVRILDQQNHGQTAFSTLSEDQAMRLVDKEEEALKETNILETLGNNQRTAASNFYKGRAMLVANQMQEAERYMERALQPDAKGNVNLTKWQIYEATIGALTAKLETHKPINSLIPIVERQIVEMEPSSKTKFNLYYDKALGLLARCYADQGNQARGTKFAEKRVQYLMAMGKDQNIHTVINSITRLGEHYVNEWRYGDAIAAMRKQYEALQSSGRTVGLDDIDLSVVDFKYHLALYYLELAHREGNQGNRKKGITLLKELQKLDVQNYKQQVLHMGEFKENETGNQDNNRASLIRISQDVSSILRKELQKR